MRVLTKFSLLHTLFYTVMKKTILLLFLLSPVWASSYVVPRDAELHISARVVDTYQLFDENTKYNLEKINMDFQVEVVSERNDLSRVVHNGGGEERMQRFERSITVSDKGFVLFEMPDKNNPLFQDVDEVPLKTMTFKSNLSEDEENLSVYFKENGKRDMLVGLLYLYEVILPLHSIEPQISSSDYQCSVRVRDGKFLCNIDLVLKTNLQELLDNMHESEDLYQKITQSLSSS